MQAPRSCGCGRSACPGGRQGSGLGHALVESLPCLNGGGYLVDVTQPLRRHKKAAAIERMQAPVRKRNHAFFAEHRLFDVNVLDVLFVDLQTTFKSAEDATREADIVQQPLVGYSQPAS